MAKTLKKDKILTALQICNKLKFTGLNRKYVYKRYIDKKTSEKEWLLLFKKDGLDL